MLTTQPTTDWFPVSAVSSHLLLEHLLFWRSFLHSVKLDLLSTKRLFYKKLILLKSSAYNIRIRWELHFNNWTILFSKFPKISGYGILIGQNYAYGYPTWQEAMEVWHDEVNDYKYGLEDQDFYYSVLITHYTQVRNFNLMNIFYISLFVNS